ncbi:hypothetical protein VM1G_01902 [Cytospora mali]|uniref:Uncharacterized protein n=1 Tax=Cytospora mali TaxID=578113 RepID=A0A194VSF0_CYTMA|nr:hypothetical protein VM1G_01902 [Valsa mali]
MASAHRFRDPTQPPSLGGPPPPPEDATAHRSSHGPNQYNTLLPEQPFWWSCIAMKAHIMSLSNASTSLRPDQPASHELDPNPIPV